MSESKSEHLELPEQKFEPPRVVDWLRQWNEVGPDANNKRAYISREISRLAAEGEAVLLATLNAPFAEQVDFALSVLRQQQPTVALRLIDGVKPPPIDSCGRPLPPQDRFRVLVAYAGDISPKPSEPKEVTARWSGPMRQAAYQRREDIHHTVRFEPGKIVHLPVDTAAIVMRHWGHSVATDQYIYRVFVLEGKRHEVAQNQWLLEEVPQNAKPAPQPQQHQQNKR